MTELWKPDEPNKDAGQKRAEFVIRELFEIGSQWGDRLIEKEHIATIDPEVFDVHSDLRLSVNTKPEDPRLIITTKSHQVLNWMPISQEDSEVTTFFLPAKQTIKETRSGLTYPQTLPQILVVLDSSLTIDDLFDLWVRLARAGNDIGLLDAENQILPYPDKQIIHMEKLDTDTIFEKEGSHVAVLPGDDVAELLESFDKPDDLIIINDPDNGRPRLITHSKWEEYHNFRVSIVQRTLKELDIELDQLAYLAAIDPVTFNPLLRMVIKKVDENFKLAWEEHKKSDQ